MIGLGVAGEHLAEVALAFGAGDLVDPGPQIGQELLLAVVAPELAGCAAIAGVPLLEHCKYNKWAIFKILALALARIP